MTVTSQITQAGVVTAISAIATNCAEPENTNSDSAMVSNGERCTGAEVASAPKMTPNGAAPTMKGSVIFRPSRISVRRLGAAASILAAACTVVPSDKREIHPRFFTREARDNIQPARDRIDRAWRADADADAVAPAARQREAAGRAHRDAADPRLQRKCIRRPILRQIEPAVHRRRMAVIGQAGQDLARRRLAPRILVAPLGGNAVAFAVVDPARGDLRRQRRRKSVV